MRFLLLTAAMLMTATAYAQEREVPYWSSIKAETLNMRAGPGRDFPIRWVYRRAGLPLKVVRVHEGWRLVRDPDGAEGWVTANLLSKERGALVIGKGLTAIRAEPSEQSRLKWNAEPGVVAALGQCDAGWCEVDVRGRAGYVRAERLWGAGKP
jgi:SH3-like domain-containing protein